MRLVLVLIGLAVGIAVQEVQAEDKYEGVREHSKKLFQELENPNYRPEPESGVLKSANIAHETMKDFEALEYLHQRAKSPEEKERIRQKMAKTVLFDEGPQSLKKGNTSVRVGNWTIFTSSDGKKASGSIIGPDGEKSVFNIVIQ